MPRAPGVRSVVRVIVGSKIQKFAGLGQAGYVWDSASQAWVEANRSSTPDVLDSVYLGSVLSVAGGPQDRVYIGMLDGLGAGRVLVVDIGAHSVRLIAGGGSTPSTTDGVPATESTLFSPVGIAADPSGPVYIADFSDNKVRRVGTDGRIVTVAGTGRPGFSGDAGPGIAAALRHPAGMTLTPGGDLLIADSGNDRVRRLSPTGLISTFAGGGPPGFSGTSGLLRLPSSGSRWMSRPTPRGMHISRIPATSAFGGSMGPV